MPCLLRLNHTPLSSRRSLLRLPFRASLNPARRQTRTQNRKFNRLLFSTNALAKHPPKKRPVGNLAAFYPVGLLPVRGTEGVERGMCRPLLPPASHGMAQPRAGAHRSVGGRCGTCGGGCRAGIGSACPQCQRWAALGKIWQLGNLTTGRGRRRLRGRHGCWKAPRTDG